MIVVLHYVHNHPIMATDELKDRKVADETRQKFLDLFKSGHSPATALESHRHDLHEQHGDDYAIITADQALLSDRAWCYKLFYATFAARPGGSHRRVQYGDWWGVSQSGSG